MSAVLNDDHRVTTFDDLQLFNSLKLFIAVTFS